MVSQRYQDVSTIDIIIIINYIYIALNTAFLSALQSKKWGEKKKKKKEKKTRNQTEKF